MKLLPLTTALALLIGASHGAFAARGPSLERANDPIHAELSNDPYSLPPGSHFEGYTYFGAQNHCETGTGGPSGGLFSTGGG